jgi:hypothetical protein
MGTAWKPRLVAGLAMAPVTVRTEVSKGTWIASGLPCAGSQCLVPRDG